jgi:hypothetical protein
MYFEFLNGGVKKGFLDGKTANGQPLFAVENLVSREERRGQYSMAEVFDSVIVA